MWGAEIFIWEPWKPLGGAGEATGGAGKLVW